MYIIVYITCGDKEEAEKIGCAIVEERLAACVNYFPINSIYRWKGKVEKGQEYVLVCKTTGEKFTKLKKKVKQLHSYELPVIVFWKIRAEKEVLDWIKDSTGTDSDGLEERIQTD